MSLYGLIWRLLPGPRWLKLCEAVVLALAVVAALFNWGFPMIAPFMPFNNNTVGQ
jgi:hypothetical protein